MMPSNIPDEAPGTSSDGLEPAAPLETPPPPTPETPPAEKSKPNMALVLLAGAGVFLALLAGAYACLLQTQMVKLQKEIRQDEFAIQAAAGKAAKAQDVATMAQTNAAGLGEQLNGLDLRAENKFKGYDECLTKSLPIELKKIPQLEARIIDDNKELATRQRADSGQLRDLRQAVETNGARLDTAIQVIRTQNDVLRKFLSSPEAKPGSKSPTP